MEQEKIKKLIIEKFDSLQPEIQSIILDENYEKNIIGISKKYQITNEQILKLEFNTTLTLMGELNPEKYEEELVTDLGLPKEKIEPITSEIKEKILKDIWQTLIYEYMNFSKIEDEIPLPPKPQTPPANLPVMTLSNSRKDSVSNNSTMESAGIEIVPARNTFGTADAGGDEKPLVNKQKIEESKMTLKEDSLLIKSGINLVEEPTIKEDHILPNTATQKETLLGIENPQNIIQQKLQGIVAQSTKVSDHNLNNHDPYREAV